MTRTVRDAASILQVIAGYDPKDTGSTDTPVQDYAEDWRQTPRLLRRGIPHAHFYEGLHLEIQAAMDGALAVLQKFTSSH